MNCRNNNTIFNDWFMLREDFICSDLSKEDRKHSINFDEISEKILNCIPKQNRKIVQKFLFELDDNFMDYVDYWHKKYYRCGFCDGFNFINTFLDK